MGVLLNHPDFTVDPSFDVVTGTSLAYDGVADSIGGVWNTTDDEYQETLGANILQSDDFTMVARVRVNSIPTQGIVTFGGGRSTSTGVVEFCVSLYNNTGGADVIDRAVMQVFDTSGVAQGVPSNRPFANWDVTVDTDVLLTWTYLAAPPAFPGPTWQLVAQSYPDLTPIGDTVQSTFGGSGTSWEMEHFGLATETDFKAASTADMDVFGLRIFSGATQTNKSISTSATNFNSSIKLEVL